MKKTTLIGIVIILILVVGIYLFSPISPLNKASVNGERVDIPEGYSIEKTTKTGLVISNGTNILQIHKANASTNIPKEIEKYNSTYGEKYNISYTKLNANTSTDVYKTVAKKDNKTAVRYWFVHKNNTYIIRSENPAHGTESVALKIINSMK